MNQDGTFEKGNIPWNKGMRGLRMSPATEFKLGHRPQTWVPVGSERKVKGYWRIKVAEPNVWRQRSHVAWEKDRGYPLPIGWLVRHLDGDKLNDDPINLRAMSRGSNLSLTLEDLVILKRRRHRCSKATRRRHEDYRTRQYDTYYWQEQVPLSD